MSNKFVPIKGFNGHYTINNKGVVKSHKHVKEGKVVAHIGKPHNAQRVGLHTPDFKPVSCRVDILVATHFVPNPHGYKYLHNISGDPKDLCYTNLEYREYPPKKYLMSREAIEEMALIYFNSDMSIQELSKNYSPSPKTIRTYLLEWAEDNGRKEEYEERAYQTHLHNIKKNRNDRTVPVSQYTTEGVFVSDYHSLTAAHDATGVPIPSIHRAANKSIIAGGFIWKLKSPKTTQ